MDSEPEIEDVMERNGRPNRELQSEREAKYFAVAVWAVAFSVVAICGMFLFWLAVLVDGWPS